MKKIAVFIENYNIDYSPSIINFMDFLSDRCLVDLFFCNVPMRSNPVLRKKNIRLIEIRRPFQWRTILDVARQRLSTGRRGDLRNAFLPNHSLNIVSRRFSGKDYHCHVTFDPFGMALCKKLFPLARPFYYSLELALRSEAGSDQTPLEMVRRWSRDIRGLIIQSPEREQLFRIDHPLAPAIPILYLPVTYRGPARTERLERLRQEYNIPSQARIAIHLGGINPNFSSLEIAEIFASLPNWYLFFQGNHPRAYAQAIRKMAKRRSARNIIISRRFFTRLEKIDEYVQSVDAGIAWYNDLNANFRTAGFSSGKISAYMRCGLPILTNNLSSMQSMVAQKGCGVCVEQIEQIPAALQKIMENYQAFSNGAIREYESRYRFENYQQSIRDFLDVE